MPDSRLERYLARFHGRQPIIDIPPAETLTGVIVIPCYLEPDWASTLRSLTQCTPTKGSFEVLVVVNASSSAGKEILDEQRQSLDDITAFTKKHSSPKLRMHVIEALNLPPKHAGVGLARKIGMDEALNRLNQAGHLERGFVVGLDADSICEPNYLSTLESHFRMHPKTPGCSLHFEHPLSGDMPPDIYETAGLYELHLRYYVQALRFAGFPHAYHTIGSSMAVRAPVYMSQGGMNRRKAGEDFYFLHKIIPLGHFTELTETTVHPSPRPSDRVPFGTGRAVSKYRGQERFPTYPWDAMLELNKFFQLIHHHNPFDNPDDHRLPKARVAPHMVEFLDSIDGWGSWASCITGTAGFDSYHRRFFQWFDGFLCMKCIHFLRDRFYGEMDVTSATRRLMQMTQPAHSHTGSMDATSLLCTMREIQKQPWSHTSSC